MLTDAQKVAICLTFRGDGLCAEDDTTDCKDASFACCYLCPHVTYNDDDVPGCHGRNGEDAHCPGVPDSLCKLYDSIKDLLWRT